MRSRLAVLLLAWAGSPLVSAAASDAQGKPPASAQDLDGLVEQLADDSFRVRENATRELWERGDDAMPALQAAASSSDPEKVFRARDLIRKIQLHITPETDPAVMGLVEHYAKASATEKVGVFAKLRAKRAWRQMLKLYSAESQAAVREKLQPAVKGVAVKAARERLYQGDPKGAREFLELGTADNEGLLALAEFHRTHGMLEAELQRVATANDPKTRIWHLALLRSAGDLAGAEKVARQCDQLEVAAAMAALDGNPLPWLVEIDDPQGGPENDQIATSYAAAAAKRWQGQKLRPGDLEPLTRRITSRNPMERIGAMNALFLLGENETAEAVLAKAAPLAAFRYYDALERVPEALKSLALDPDHPDYKSWVEKELRKLLTDANDIEDQHAPSDRAEQLAAVANFLERRGMHAEALAAFAEPLAAFAAKDADAFADLLGKLFGTRESLSGSPQLASKLAVAWAGDDDDRWRECVLAAFGDDDQTNGWWDWLADLDPQATRPQRLDAMLALLGLGTDPADLRSKWTALAWKQVAETPAEKREPLLVRLSALSVLAGDVATSLKAWDKLSEDGRKEVFWGEHILHLSAAERWDEAATVLLAQMAAAKQANQEPSVQLHAYAASALRQAGRQDEAAAQDEWVDKLVLGNATIAMQVGNGYAFGRDYERAAQWWQRAARYADPSANEFAVALKLHADVLLEKGQWQETAAVSEVLCRSYAASGFRGASPLPLMHQRLTADTAHALAQLGDHRAASLATLRKCHQQFVSDGSLADFFFPALRKVGLLKEHDEWFAETWEWMDAVIRRFPASDNSRNTAAWFAARAVRKLDAAEKLLQQALASDPHQSAYLDTMAEIQFAKGNRGKALEWSREAVNYLPSDPQLRQQQERFRSEALPGK